MGRTQLNINIDPRLMLTLKKNAIKSGKTISEFVADAITNQVNNDMLEKNLEDRLSSVEQRLSSIENRSSIVSSKEKITPITERIKNLSVISNFSCFCVIEFHHFSFYYE